jgi:hypothetical protein
MPGLGLKVGGFGAATATPQANYSPGPGPSGSAMSAAFGPGYSAPAQSTGQVLAPNDPFGVAFWAGIVGVVGLLLIRRSLPR